MAKPSCPKLGRSPLSADGLQTEILRISQLPAGDLQKLWQSRYGKAPPEALTKDLIARALCHALQEEMHGGISAAMRKRLKSIAMNGQVPARHLKPGSIIVRDYQGKTHQVMVLAAGFAWEGKTYQSLSAIARKITGTVWNGHRFFGISEPAARGVPAESEPARLIGRPQKADDRADKRAETKIVSRPGRLARGPSKVAQPEGEKSP